MTELENFLRAAVIGQLVLVGIVVAARERPRFVAAAWLLFLGIMSYILLSGDRLALHFEPWLPALGTLAVAVPFFFWYFCAVLFDIPLPHRAWYLAPAIVLAQWYLYLQNPGIAGFGYLTVAATWISALAVLHALVNAWRSRVDDLFEPRRRFRALFVTLIGAFMIFTLVTEWLLSMETLDALEIFSAATMLLLTTTLGVPFVSSGPWTKDVRPATSREPGPQDDRHFRALELAMEQRAYAEAGLTIGRLAHRLEMQEHELRKLINQRLGHRNFANFINGYRISEACQRLSDPAESKVPILTIALDAGFASIGPFNRSFREFAGVTPTEFRNRKKTGSHPEKD